MNKNMIIWALLPTIIIIMFRYERGFNEYIKSWWDKDWKIKDAYNEALNCGYIGTLKDYIRMVGVKKDDNT